MNSQKTRTGARPGTKSKMITPSSDLTKITLSMATGMILVVGLVALKTRGDMVAVAIASSLPFGVIILWAVYHFKMTFQTRRVKREPLPIPEAPIEITFGRGAHDNPLAPLPLPPQHLERLVIKNTRPKVHDAAKERLLTGRSPISKEKIKLDQWHD